MLNTFLVIIAFAYIKPRDFFRALFDKKNGRQALMDQLFNLRNSDQVKAISIGVGVFSGILPIWGFQIFVAIFLAFAFRLNTALAIIASNISIPPMIPLVIFFSYKMGGLWMGDKTIPLAFSMHITLKSIGLHLEQYIYGSMTLAVVAGLLAALLTLILLRQLKRKAVSAL
jgi:uncharacterized protein (DUF2062 family)